MASDLAETRKSHNNNKVSNINMSHFFATCDGLQRTWLRKIEKVGKRLSSNKWRVVFLRACIKDNLIPRFISDIYVCVLQYFLHTAITIDIYGYNSLKTPGVKDYKLS